MSESSNGVSAEHVHGETVTISRQEYDRYQRIEEQLETLAERVDELEAQQERNTAVTPEFRGDGEQAISDLWIGSYPVGVLLDNARTRTEANEEAIEELRNNAVTQHERVDVESLLPIQRIHQTYRTDPDRLRATERRAAIIWDHLDDVTTRRAGAYAFDSKDVTDVLAGANEDTSRTTVGRVIELLADKSEDVITETTGPKGRTLAEVDKSRYEARIDEIRKEIEGKESVQ